MKKVLLFAGLLTFGSSFAQNCSKIFISEYVEGLSNNKALEIYNPTSQPVDLSEYIVARYSNGSNTAAVWNAIQLSGTVAPYDVFVAVLDKRDPQGTGLEAPVWDSLLVKGDGFFNPIYATSAGSPAGGRTAFYWNGNDAVVLFKGTLPTNNESMQLTAITPQLQVIDIFGKIGEGTSFQSSEGWSTTAPYNTGAGVVVTADHSLIRKPSIQQGVTNFAIPSFNPLGEYDSIPLFVYRFDQNGDTILNGDGNPRQFGNFFSLGTHACQCDPSLGLTEEPVKAHFALYPNPSVDGTFHVTATTGITNVTVFNSLGQTVYTKSVSGNNALIQLGDLSGVYIVRAETGSGVVTKRVIIK
jgi:hypothetical protein